MFCHNKFGKPPYVISGSILIGMQVVFGAVDKAYNVGILLYRSRFTEVAKLWTLAISTRFNGTVELRKRYNRNIKLFCKLLDRKSVV